MAFIRSLAFALAFYIGTFLFVLVALVAFLFGRNALIRIVIAWAGYHRVCVRYLLGQRIRVVGDLPQGTYLIIAKHESMFETIDLVCLLDRPMIAAKQELLDIPLWGTAAKLYGLIGVERGAGSKALRAMRAAGKEAMRQGRPVVLFPEGTRVPHGARPPIKAGFAGLYAMLDLPVVPIAIDSGRLSPRGRFIKRSGVITYKVGEILPPGLPRAEAEAQVHAAINALNPPEQGSTRADHP